MAAKLHNRKANLLHLFFNEHVVFSAGGGFFLILGGDH